VTAPAAASRHPATASRCAASPCFAVTGCTHTHTHTHTQRPSLLLAHDGDQHLARKARPVLLQLPHECQHVDGQLRAVLMQVCVASTRAVCCVCWWESRTHECVRRCAGVLVGVTAGTAGNARPAAATSHPRHLHARKALMMSFTSSQPTWVGHSNRPQSAAHTPFPRQPHPGATPAQVCPHRARASPARARSPPPPCSCSPCPPGPG
jgi:hypothetical protein